MDKSEQGEMILEYLEYVRKTGLESIIERDKFTVERTIKTLEIFISSSIGFLGFISLGIFLQEDLNDSLGFIIVFILLTLFGIIVNFYTRHLIVSINEQAFSRRSKIFEEVDSQIGKELLILINTQVKDVFDRLKSLKENELNELKNINDELANNNIAIYFRIAVFLFIAQMIFLFLILITLLNH